MKELLIGDIHFGIKSNSIDWLNKQCEFINKQIINIVKNTDINRVVFLGDVFDVRYSINQQVASEVKSTIRNLAIELKNKNAYCVFVAGNHDYYSPLEEASKYNAYETVFGSEFLKVHDNVYFVTNEPLYIDESLFLPWYWTENTDHFDDILYRYNFGKEVKAIYCHADLSVWPGARIASLKGIPVYAGHIHYIVEDKLSNLFNIGACCPLTFGDANEDRYIYLLEDFSITKQIKNNITPKFIRIYNDEIFNTSDDMFVNSYLQICLSKKYLNDPKYLDRIKTLKNTYIDSNIRIHLIEDIDDNENIENKSFINSFSNINDYINDNLPESLNNKFKFIKEKYNTK